MPRPLHPAANSGSLRRHFGKQRVRAVKVAARTGAHHEGTQHRAGLQILLAHRAGQRRIARRPAAAHQSGRLRSARAARQTLRSKFQSARRSSQAKPPGWPRPSARSASPHRAVASSGRNPISERTKLPASTNETSSCWPTESGSICAMGSDISVLDGRTTSAGIRASRAAIASANAYP